MKNKRSIASPAEAAAKKLLAAEARRIRHAEWWATHSLCSVFYVSPDSPSGLRYAMEIVNFKGTPLRALGDVAGVMEEAGYWRVNVAGRAFFAHRIVYALVHGESPTADIDHIDGNPSNNSIENLRDVSRSLNIRNQRLKKLGESGVAGVGRTHFKNRHNYWRARWHTQEGKKTQKVFSIEALGNDEALRQAIAYRAAMLAGIGGYTKDHGTLAAPRP